MTTDAKKILFAFVVLSKFARKIFFSSKFFDQSKYVKNAIKLFDFFIIGIERSINPDAKKILWTSVVLSKTARKIIFTSKFFDQSEFEKNEIQLFDVFIAGIERSMNTDAKKILLTSVVLSKIREKKIIFFHEIFRPIRIREKIEFNDSTFSSFESRDQ